MSPTVAVCRQASTNATLPRHRKKIYSIYCRPLSSQRATVSMPNSDATVRVERVNGYATELIEILVEAPKLRIVFIPGNPGIILFYKRYLEALSQILDGKANVTGIGYLGHTSKDWEERKLFSLEDQVEHKIHFIQSSATVETIPLVLVGHSIGAHVALCVFKRCPDKVQHVIALYPFLAINERSSFQALLKWSLRQRFLCEALGYFASLLGKVPTTLSRCLLKNTFGRSWSSFVLDVACQYLLQHSIVRQTTYLGMTEFQKLQRHPDWEFIKGRQGNISILFGVDDHWGPLTLFEEMAAHVPNVDVEIEREGHDHAFCCTDEGSYWVAAYCVKTIRNMLPFLHLD